MFPVASIKALLLLARRSSLLSRRDKRRGHADEKLVPDGAVRAWPSPILRSLAGGIGTVWARHTHRDGTTPLRDCGRTSFTRLPDL